MAKISKILVKNVKRLMQKQGLNQAELAKKTGIPGPNLNQILNGVSTNPGLDRIEKLAQALGVSEAYLLTDRRSVSDERPLTEDDYRRAVSEWGKALAKRHKTVDGVLLALIEGLREVLEESQSKKSEE